MIYNNNISSYSLYLCLIFVLSYGAESFIPNIRVGHTSTLVGNKLYFFGGVDGIRYYNEVFYLDLSQPFNVENPPWVDLTPKAAIPFGSIWATSALDNTNNDLNIYLFGGITLDVNTNEDLLTSFVYRLNVNSLTWSIPPGNGMIPERRRNIDVASDNSGKFYILGGSKYDLSGFVNDMVIFNTIGSSLSISYPLTPTQLAAYSATLISNGVIVYIGGYTTGKFNADISQINLYDTKSSAWSVKTAKFINPVENRSGHSAVLAQNDKIIVFGGVNNRFAKVSPDIAVLNTKTEPFEWTAPLVSTNIGKFPSLQVHSADLFENYMIVAFGNTTGANKAQLEFNTEFYLMDISNYTWVSSFEIDQNKTTNQPTTTPATSATSNPQLGIPPSGNNNGLVVKIVAIVVSVVGVVIIIGIFLIYKYKIAIHNRNERSGVSGESNIVIVDSRQ